MGNNNNRENEKPPKFPGALVGDPLNNNNFSKIKINGQYVNIVNNLDDFDYKSLYPSIMREFGIAPNTQIGKVIIDNVVWEKENPFKYDKYCRGGQFMQDFHSGNYIEFCNRWLHLASYKEMLEDMKEYTSKYPLHGIINPTQPQQMVRMFGNKDVKHDLVRFNQHSLDNKNMVVFYPEKQDFSEHLAYIKENAQMDIDNIEMVMRRMARAAEEDKETAKEFGYERSIPSAN